MDNEVYIKLIRDDLKEFLIDGNTWVIPSKDGIDGFGDYENDFTLVDNAIGDGAIVSSYRMGTIDRTIRFYNKNARETNEVLRKEVLSFFNTKHVYKIYVHYMGVTRWCDGMVHKASIPTQNINWRMDISVTFLCNNPYMKSYDDFGKDIAAVVGSGFPYLCTATRGRTQGYFAFSQYVVLNNDGDVPAKFKAVFKANGTVTNPKLIIGNAYVKVNTTLQENDEISMDFTASPPTIKKNGANCIGLCDKRSAFDEMYLNIGDTEISYTADSGTNLVSVSIYYNKLYCGI